MYFVTSLNYIEHENHYKSNATEHVGDRKMDKGGN